MYKLHRETYYLALDFVDRYLSIKHDIAKQRLQLVGTTALFIAAKTEVRMELHRPVICLIVIIINDQNLMKYQHFF